MAEPFDKTKKKIGVDKMNNHERKDMFDKFVDGGGKVAQNKKKRLLTIDRDKQKEYLKKDGEARANRREYDYGSEGVYRRNWSSLLDKLIVRIKGSLNQTTVFFGGAIQESFFQYVRSKVIPQLKNLDIIINYILTTSEKSYEEIKATWDAKELYYHSLFLKYSELFNDELYEQFMHYYHSGSKNIQADKLKEPLKELMAKVYILRNFKVPALNIFRSALAIIGHHKNWSKPVLNREMIQVRNVVQMLFSQFLPKLHILLMNVMKENILIDSSHVSRFLGIEDEDLVDFSGKKRSGMDDMLPQVSKETEEIMKKKMEEMRVTKKSFYDLKEEDITALAIDDTYLIQGITLMQDVDWKTAAMSYKKEFRVDKSPENDKMLHILVYLKEFEEEYSFVLTSHKVNVTDVYEENKRIDYKNKLNDMYTPLTSMSETLHAYFEILRNIDDVKTDPSLGDVETYNRINKYEAQRSKASLDFRTDLLDYCGQLQEYFDKFIEDYNGVKTIIQNPDDILHFDKHVEGNKKTEGKSVIDAIIMVDSFITAFIYRLDEGGDMSGMGVEIKPVEVPTGMSEEEEQKHDMDFLDELAESLDGDSE